MHNMISHHLLTHAQSISKHCLALLIQLHIVYTLRMKFYGIEYPFVQIRSAVSAMLLHSFFCTYLLKEYGKLKNI